MHKIEDMFRVMHESSDNKSISSHIQKNSSEIEKDSRLTVSESKLDCDKIPSKHPLILDIKEGRRGRCSQMHKHCSCSNPLIFSTPFDFNSSSRSTSPLCIHSAELSLDSLHIFCRKGSLLSTPPALATSTFKCKNYELRRKIHDACTNNNLMVGGSPIARSWNLALSPPTRWISNSIQESLKTKTLMNNSDMRGVNMKQIMEMTDQLNILSGQSNRESFNPQAVITPCRVQRSELSSSQELHLTCSSSSPCHSASPSVLNSAILQYVWESGYPYFTLSMGTDDMKVYIASPHKMKSSVDKALDFIYLFHAWTYQRKESKNHVHRAPNFVGKMKVRSSLLPSSSSQSKCVETEFVLSAAKEGSSSELQRLTKSKGLHSKLSEIFRGSQRTKSNSMHNISVSSSQFEYPPELSVSEAVLIDDAVCPRLISDDFSHHLELAAIVVKDFRFEHKQEATFGGWGLKFLEKVEPPCPDSHCKEREVTVLVPAGIHGVSLAGTCGPDSLTERWSSNGHCDCGGWDVGCSLTLLNNTTTLHESSEEDSKPLSLFVQGAKHQDPAFQMLRASKDMYVVNFMSTLSALQSFSIAVASIHSQYTDLYPKWRHISTKKIAETCAQCASYGISTHIILT